MIWWGMQSAYFMPLRLVYLLILRWLMVSTSFFGVAWAIAVILWVGQYIQIRGINQDSINYGQIFSQNVWIGFILLLGIILGVR